MASGPEDSFTEKYLQGKIPESMKGSRAPDLVLRPFGFQVDLASSDRISGRFTVTHCCCQPFNVLHGGVSALISEALASMGAHISSGFKRIAGIELNINHLKAASLGMTVYASAKPISVGRRVQVWEVKFWNISASDVSWQIDTSALPGDSILAVSRVTFLVGLPISSSTSKATEGLNIRASM